MPWAIYIGTEKASADFATGEEAWAEALRLGFVKENIPDEASGPPGPSQLDEGYEIKEVPEPASRT